MLIRVTGLLAVACIVVSGCAHEGVDTPHVEVRDSSGIRIVQSVPPFESPVTVSAEPIYRIGWAASDPQFQRIYFGSLRADGRALIVDGGASSLYVLDPNGVLATTIGRAGEGPGEFSRISSLVTMPGDSFLVSDSGNRRVTVFHGVDLVGEHRFQGFFPPAFAIYDPIARDQNGSYWLGPTAWPAGLAEQGDPGWLETPLLRTRDFAAVDTIASTPFLMATGDRNPIQHVGRIVAAGSQVVRATTDVAEAWWLGPDGAPTQIARWDASPRSLTDADWDRYEAGFRDRNASRDPERIEQSLRDARPDFGGTEPLFRRMVGDQLGGVWLAPYDVAAAGLQSLFVSTYEVLAQDGVHLGTVTFPNRIQIIDVTEDRVLGIELNGLDVQAVVLYALDRGASHVR